MDFNKYLSIRHGGDNISISAYGVDLSRIRTECEAMGFQTQEMYIPDRNSQEIAVVLLLRENEAYITYIPNHGVISGFTFMGRDIRVPSIGAYWDRVSREFFEFSELFYTTNGKEYVRDDMYPLNHSWPVIMSGLIVKHKNRHRQQVLGFNRSENNDVYELQRVVYMVLGGLSFNHQYMYSINTDNDLNSAPVTTTQVWQKVDGYSRRGAFTGDICAKPQHTSLGPRFRSFIEAYKHKILVCMALDSRMQDIKLTGTGKVEISETGAGFDTYHYDGSLKAESFRSGKMAKALLSVRHKRGESLMEYYRVGNKHLEEFSTALKSFMKSDEYKVEVLPAPQIERVYNSPYVNRGRISTSCLRKKGHLFRDMHRCKNLRIMVVWNRDGLVAGRALVWEAKHRNGKCITIMDRMYSCAEHIDAIMSEHAAKMGAWRRRSTQREGRKHFVSPVGEIKELKLRVELPEMDLNKRWPYLDTFPLIHSTGKSAYNYHTPQTSFLACETNGLLTFGF